MGERKRFLLRLDQELFDALRRWADDDLRSINAQIEFLLAEQVQRAGRWPVRGRGKGTAAGDDDEEETGVGDGVAAGAADHG